MQVLADAAAVDAKAGSGQDITPLCGMPLVRCQVAAQWFGSLFVMAAMLMAVAEYFTYFERLCYNNTKSAHAHSFAFRLSKTPLM